MIVLSGKKTDLLPVFFSWYNIYGGRLPPAVNSNTSFLAIMYAFLSGKRRDRNPSFFMCYNIYVGNHRALSKGHKRQEKRSGIKKCKPLLFSTPISTPKGIFLPQINSGITVVSLETCDKIALFTTKRLLYDA